MVVDACNAAVGNNWARDAVNFLVARTVNTQASIRVIVGTATGAGGL